MKFFSLAAFAALAGTAYAQSQCVLTCSAQAATLAGCASFADPACVCTSATFQNAAGACLLANCTQAEQQQSVQLQAALCAGRSVTSGSVTVTLASATGSTQLPTALPSVSGGSSSVSSVSSLVSSAVSAASSTSAVRASSSSSSSSVAATSAAATSAAATSRAAGGERYELGLGAIVGAVVGVMGVLAGGAAVL